VCGRGEAYTGICRGNMRESEHLGDRGVVWGDNIKIDVQEFGYGVWNSLSWLRTGTVGRHMRIR
jgi:hypothetical protein